jgi:hypothetical protein
MKAIEAAGPLTPFQCLDGRVLIALDGTEHFCSRKIKCEGSASVSYWDSIFYCGSAGYDGYGR